MQRRTLAWGPTRGLFLLLSLLLFGTWVFGTWACGRAGDERPAQPEEAAVDTHGFTAPTAATSEANARVVGALPLDDASDFEDARRGLIAGDGPVIVKGPQGKIIWDTSAYDFERGGAPASVNPSLWRQAQLNDIHGLFRVTEGVYQVRGYDLSNLSVIEGKSGWIVVDPLISEETARAAMELVRTRLGSRPVSALIFTHSHVDHFGGVGGVLAAGEAGRNVRIVAPRGFMRESTSENVLAGVAMSRRAAFMFGRHLPRGPRGHVGSGLGKAPALGTIGIRAPTDLVDHTPQEMEIDGVRFVFQYAPGTEAPAELTFYLPDRKAFCSAEIVTHNLHNLYTLRGAKVRDALLWSGAIDEAMDLFGDAEVLFASHHWPMWGRERIRDYLAKQRDVYKYIHDQTLRMANDGATPKEIAERLVLPESLRDVLGARGYYGTVRHDAKAVYQWYFGWYDGNPAHLDPLPPAEAGARYVRAMGGAEAVLREARRAFEAADYRWVAELLDHLVFAEPENAEARDLLARAYDQLGYQAESGPWRDEYLTAALELRHGTSKESFTLGRVAALLAHTPLERFLESLAARIDGPSAAGEKLVLNLVVTDVERSFVLRLENAVLHHEARPPDLAANVTIRVTRELLLRLFTRQVGLRELVSSHDLEIEGSRIDLVRFLALLEKPNASFPIVTP